MYDPEYHKKYYLANKAKKREQGRRWEANNQDKVRAYRKNRREKLKAENPELLSAATRRWEQKNPEKVLLRAAKARATKKNMEFNIDVSDIVIPECCPLLEIKLEFKRGSHGPHDASPTLDRIDSKKGYVKGNVWVISLMANKIKTNATVEQITLLSKNLERLVKKK